LTQHSPRGCPLRRTIRGLTSRNDVTIEPTSSHRVDLNFKVYTQAPSAVLVMHTRPELGVVTEVTPPTLRGVQHLGLRLVLMRFGILSCPWLTYRVL
jgi:hypothetical protein